MLHFHGNQQGVKIVQDTQMLKAKIVSLLELLPADSLNLLAEFAAFLGAKSGSNGTEPSTVQSETGLPQIQTDIDPRQAPISISSPRLVKREQIAAFKLEVIEETYDSL